MRFTCDDTAFDLTLSHAIVAGWTGRDQAAIEHHIEELAEIGVTRPSAVPLFYRVSAQCLTQAPAIEVVGTGTSGEVEPLFVHTPHGDYLGLASDHTDRDLEAHSVALSKQICAKPVGNELWTFDSVKNHLDEIKMRSWVLETGEWTLYQEGALSAILPLADLVATSGINDMPLGDGEAAVMLCGTFGVLSGGVRPAGSFRMELVDPVLDRAIQHGYETHTLPIVA